jgi:hypothetical protein
LYEGIFLGIDRHGNKWENSHDLSARNGNKMGIIKWINVHEELPEIDFKNKKSSIKVFMKIKNKPKIGYFRLFFRINGEIETAELNQCYGMFYILDGETYKPESWAHYNHCLEYLIKEDC